jgi:hypothetical protein
VIFYEEYKEIIPLNSIKRLAILMEIQGAFCEIGTELLNNIRRLQRTKILLNVDITLLMQLRKSLYINSALTDT